MEKAKGKKLFYRPAGKRKGMYTPTQIICVSFVIVIAVKNSFLSLHHGACAHHGIAIQKLDPVDLPRTQRRALPLKSFTVLVCDFANWAETAPLPCIILKK